MNDSDSLSDNINLQHRFPMQVKVLQTAPSDSQLLYMNEHNDKVLSQVMSLDDMSAESEDDIDSSPEIARLEHKLNLLLDMVGTIVATDINLPAEINVTLYGSHIEWIHSKKLEIEKGAWLELKVWLRNDYPKPFQIFVILDSQQAEAGGQRVHCKYHGFSEGIRDQLEKMIFRHHRRVIAQSRLTG